MKLLAVPIARVPITAVTFKFSYSETRAVDFDRAAAVDIESRSAGIVSFIRVGAVDRRQAAAVVVSFIVSSDNAAAVNRIVEKLPVVNLNGVVEGDIIVALPRRVSNHRGGTVIIDRVIPRAAVHC